MEKKRRPEETGAKMEARAARYLQEGGMRLLATNFRCRQGEIDIIGYENGYLTFVEVKYRRDIQGGLPEEAVTASKQRKICRAADYYRYLHHYGDESPFRYDVVAILGDEIRWYRNAFEHIQR